MKGFSLCFSGCSSNSDSGDESTETQMSKFCEPSPGKPGNTKSGNTFQLYKVSSAIKPFPFLISASKRVCNGSMFVCMLYSYKIILQIEHAYELCYSRGIG